MSATPDAWSDSPPLLRVAQLSTHFPTRGGGTLRAVDDVTFDVQRGQTLGLVGESGCGKSTLARTILRLIPPTTGSVHFDGVDLLTLSRRALNRLRRHLQIVFQDPIGSLNPRLRVGTIVGEALAVHGLAANAQDQQRRIGQALERVGLHAGDAAKYPHEFSGGQRQRIGIARALALEPKLIVCDEPVSALDVSVQAQILNLLSDLKRDLDLTYLFIAHDLAVVHHISDEIAVMYRGQIVEQAAADDLFADPHHPYTHELLTAVPQMTPDGLPALPVEEAASVDAVAIAGCPYHPRCSLADAHCRTKRPPLIAHDSDSPSHRAACHHAARLAPPHFPGR